MLENTIENKELFFAQYFHQTVHKWESSDTLFKITRLTFDFSIKDSCLVLRSINDISEVDIIKLCDFQHIKSPETDDDLLSAKDKLRETIENESIIYTIIDFLRSKGYAVPFMNTSVETMINYKWIILK